MFDFASNQIELRMIKHHLSLICQKFQLSYQSAMLLVISGMSEALFHFSIYQREE